MAAGIACENCVAACCRKQTLLLLTDEDVYKNRHQMKLQRLVKAKPYPSGPRSPRRAGTHTGTRSRSRRP